MIVAMQGLVILFSGALAYMNRPWVARVYAMLDRRAVLAEAAGRQALEALAPQRIVPGHGRVMAATRLGSMSALKRWYTAFFTSARLAQWQGKGAW